MTTDINKKKNKYGLDTKKCVICFIIAICYLINVHL